MDTNEYINDFREQIADLIEAQKGSLGYVVKCGPLWIKFTTGFDNTGTPTYTNPVACGALQATVFRTRGDAYRLGKYVQNGGGARGIPQERSEAIQDSIDSLTSSIAFLEQNVVKA